MTAVLEQLRAAHAELVERIVDDALRLQALEDDRDRIAAAIAALQGASARPAEPVASRRADEARAKLHPRPRVAKPARAPAVQKPRGVERIIDPPPPPAGPPGGAPSPRVDGALNAGAKPKRVPHNASGVTPEDVLKNIGTGWQGAGAIAAATGIGVKALRARLDLLLADGRIESKGVRAGTRYRLTGAGDGGDGGSAPVTAATSTPQEPPAPAADREAGLVDRGLTDKIEGMLSRARGPLSARDIAKSLVVSVADVAQQLNIMVKQTERGRYPGVHRDPSGCYSLLLEAAA